MEVRLHCPPGSIRVDPILRMTEPGKSLIDCFTQPYLRCADCLRKRALDQCYAPFFAKTDKFTLADTANTATLKLLLQAPSIRPSASQYC